MYEIRRTNVFGARDWNPWDWCIREIVVHIFHLDFISVVYVDKIIDTHTACGHTMAQRWYQASRSDIEIYLFRNKDKMKLKNWMKSLGNFPAYDFSTRTQIFHSQNGKRVHAVGAVEVMMLMRAHNKSTGYKIHFILMTINPKMYER